MNIQFVLSLFVGAAAAVAVPALTGCSALQVGPAAVDRTTARPALTASVCTLDLATLAGAESGWEKPEREITLNITGRRVSGVSGVNRYFGAVEFDTSARTIRFGELGATRMAGPGLSYETAYLKMLSTVTAYRISGNVLTLMAGEKPVAEFSCVRQPEK